MANSSKLTREEISKYLGEERTKVLENFTEKDWNFYASLKINPEKSYFFEGSASKLKKAEAYFLFMCGYKKPFHKTYLINEYANILSAPIGADVDAIGIDRELVILYAHSIEMGYGNTEAWVFTTVLNKIASRNRQNNPTLVLSERSILPFRNTDELEYVNLGNSKNVVQTAEAAQGAAQNSSGTSGGTVFD